ncbi:hypothetical protein PAXINDRAFT_169422, partial [Paxillus involutus ATCC 200175]
TDTHFEEYIQTYLFPDAPPTTTQELMEFYPANISQGSPFDTGFKRIAAFQGDVTFEAPRLFLLQQRSGKQPLWTYIKRLKTVPVLGSFHGSDISSVYGGEDLAPHLVRFVNNLDPNGGTDLYWPQYTTGKPHMLEFLDGSIPQALTEDTYRVEAM